MYAIHTTPGFIIESRPVGEAGKLLSIFTRDLGLVWATAQGIRLEKSKLRYYSQEYSLGEFSFVRGKEFWRLTSAGESPPRSILGVVRRQPVSKANGAVVTGLVDLRSPRQDQELIACVALLLRRLLQGEETHPELFTHIEESFNFIEDHPDLSAEQFQTLESIIVFRILHLLGYIGTDKGLDQKLISAKMGTELIDSATVQRMEMNRHINKALRESHL